MALTSLLTAAVWAPGLPVSFGSEPPAASSSLPASTVNGVAITGHVGPTAKNGQITYEYAGDSITARADSWLHVLADNSTLNAVDGYARSGARSDEVLTNLPATHGVDVLVIEVGTNDVNQGKSAQSIVANIRAIAAKASTAHVLLTAAPPSNKTDSRWGTNRQQGSQQLNTLLRAEAQKHGWSFTDPYASLREDNNGWARGTSTDGIHPTAAASVTIARSMSVSITSTSTPVNP